MYNLSNYISNNNFNGEPKIGVIGLGYVGLPIACLFASKFPVTGYDINQDRVQSINKGEDYNNEVSPQLFANALKNGFKATTNPEKLRGCNIFIIAVPTPVDGHNKPLLDHLTDATITVGKLIDKNALVIYESTVAPGTTEDKCAPLIEKVSGLVYNEDFFIGYSPERINPGDIQHTIENIPKITSGSTRAVGEYVDALYRQVLKATTYLAPNIKTAEAAKILENTQRDVNIALMNEMAKVFHRMGINTMDVINAASSKWNFLRFTPGLVGGHCIGVDPYYLISMAEDNGVDTPLISTARRINNSMGKYVVERINEILVHNGTNLQGKSILILGFTFKEDCLDLRNTKVEDVYNELIEQNSIVTVCDPVASVTEVKHRYGIECIDDITNLPEHQFDVIIHAVNHRQFKDFDYSRYLKDNGFVFNVKGETPADIPAGHL